MSNIGSCRDGGADAIVTGLEMQSVQLFWTALGDSLGCDVTSLVAKILKDSQKFCIYESYHHVTYHWKDNFMHNVMKQTMLNYQYCISSAVVKLLCLSA